MSKLLFFFVAYRPELTIDPNKENMSTLMGQRLNSRIFRLVKKAISFF